MPGMGRMIFAPLFCGLIAATQVAVAREQHSKDPRTVATFESIGLYWSPGSDPGPGGCDVRYRRHGEREWRDALSLWYDARDGECRGSLVHLAPGASYEIHLRAGHASATLTANTWQENFPVGKTIRLPEGTRREPLVIRDGGSPDAYVLYEAHPKGTAIDAGDRHAHNVEIAAPYVIVRGLELRGAQRDAIVLREGAHDVVIEDNDISGWGRYRKRVGDGWAVGVDMDSGIRANCTRWEKKAERIVIQRNRIRDPRYGANSWSFGHPAGPQGITFSHCGGNHVIRRNDITSDDPRRYFNDAIGGEDNFSAEGFPHSDTDIYGNLVRGAWDDGIEVEGGNRNVRVWGNFIDRTAIGIASTVTHYGPLYLFRNVYARSRKLSEREPDRDDRGPMFKAGAHEKFGGGRRYVFHNTALQPRPEPGARLPGGAGGGISGNTRQPLTNTVTRNNIFHVWRPDWPSIRETGPGGGNDADYDLYNGRIVERVEQRHGVRGAPVIEPDRESGYRLARRSPGVDEGARLPNFNDGFHGRAPDIGAQELGAEALHFGIPSSARRGKSPSGDIH